MVSPDSFLFGVCCGVGTCMAFQARSRIALNWSLLTKRKFQTNSNHIKYVVCVRQDLKMGKGKIAAQCCHAAVQSYRKICSENHNILKNWELSGQWKTIVKCQNEEELLLLSKHALRLGVLNVIIQDAGNTQLAPATRTVVGIGPGPVDLIDQITGHLKLL